MPQLGDPFYLKGFEAGRTLRGVGHKSVTFFCYSKEPNGHRFVTYRRMFCGPAFGRPGWSQMWSHAFWTFLWILAKCFKTHDKRRSHWSRKVVTATPVLQKPTKNCNMLFRLLLVGYGCLSMLILRMRASTWAYFFVRIASLPLNP